MSPFDKRISVTQILSGLLTQPDVLSKYDNEELVRIAYELSAELERQA